MDVDLGILTQKRDYPRNTRSLFTNGKLITSFKFQCDSKSFMSGNNFLLILIMLKCLFGFSNRKKNTRSRKGSVRVKLMSKIDQTGCQVPGRHKPGH